MQCGRQAALGCHCVVLDLPSPCGRACSLRHIATLTCSCRYAVRHDTVSQIMVRGALLKQSEIPMPQLASVAIKLLMQQAERMVRR